MIANEHIEPASVASLLAKRPPARYKLVHEIVSGQLDADRADYLLRDSHCCGVKYGEYDFPRFLQIFAAVEDENTGNLSLTVDESDLHVAESLLVARYHYNIQVPFHRTRSGYDCVLRRFIQDFPEYQKPFTVEDGKLTKVDLEALTDLDDYSIMERAKKEKMNNTWAPYLLRTRHLIPIVDTSDTSKQGIKLFKNLALAFNDLDVFTEDEDFFYPRQ